MDFSSRHIGPSSAEQQHMLASAEYYTQQNEIDHWQIDVIAVERVKGSTEIMHFEKAI